MNRESLSALFDGECSGRELDQLMAALDQDAGLRSEWSRLCVARQAVQGKARRHDEALTRSIMAAIARDSQAAPVSRIPLPRSWTWLRPVGAYALAAGIGGLAVFGLLPKTGGEAATTVADIADVSQDPYIADHQKVRALRFGGAGIQRASYSPEGSY